MEHNKKRDRLEAQTCLFLSAFLLLSLISACGGVVPPPPKKAGTAPQDKPLVVSTIPADKEVDVILNKSVSVTFTKEMSSETLNDTNILLDDITDPNVPVPVTGVVTMTGTTAVFKPAVDLKGLTPFKVTVTQGVLDTFGNSLAEELMWTFTSIALSDPGSTDVDPPSVVATDPVNGEKNVSTNTSISVTFDEAIDPSTIIALGIETDTFIINKGAKAKTILFSTDGKTVTFVLMRRGKNGLLDGLKDGETRYDVTITTGVKDLSGNSLFSDFNWSFTTVLDTFSGGGE